MKPHYNEGTLFAVPLRRGGYAVGLVARTSPQGIMLTYLFGPARTEIPPADDLSNLRPQNALQVVRVGDLSLIDKTWPIIGQIKAWKREEWVMPSFVRRDDIMKKAWRVQYSDTDANLLAFEEPMSYTQGTEFERDAVLGAGAAEIRLTKLLT